MLMQERVNKVAEGLRRHISIILNQKVKDPVIQFITIKEVDLSPDLKNAKVKYLILDEKEDDSRKVARHLRRAASYIRKELAKDMTLKYTPWLEFAEDGSIRKKQEMDELYRKIRDKEEKDGC